MNKQRGHYDFSFLGWLVGAVGLVLTCGGVWLLWLAAKIIW